MAGFNLGGSWVVHHPRVTVWVCLPNLTKVVTYPNNNFLNNDLESWMTFLDLHWILWTSPWFWVWVSPMSGVKQILLCWQREPTSCSQSWSRWCLGLVKLKNVLLPSASISKCVYLSLYVYFKMCVEKRKAPPKFQIAHPILVFLKSN